MICIRQESNGDGGLTMEREVPEGFSFGIQAAALTFFAKNDATSAPKGTKV
jgi:hypothetical protein